MCFASTTRTRFKLTSSKQRRFFFLFSQHVLSVSASQWASHVKWIISTTAATVGDALRRVGDEGVIETDFVLLHADAVGNMNLGRVLEQHRLRKEADPTVLMTSIYKRATATHASRSLEDDTVLGLSKDNEVTLFFVVVFVCSAY